MTVSDECISIFKKSIEDYHILDSVDQEFRNPFSKNEVFKNVLLVDELSDTGLTLNESIKWLKNYAPVKNHIKEIKTACLWKKKSSSFTPDFCPILLDGDPWIVQPSEYYDEIDINGLKKKHS